MSIVALIGLRASYQNGHVRMSWQFPPNAPEAVHIFAVKVNGSNAELDMYSHIARELRDCNSGLSFEYSNVYGNDVRRVVFCAYLSERGDSFPSIRALQVLQGCFVSVITGHANVIYEMKSKHCGYGFSSHQITLWSTAEFDAGILGYSYNFNGTAISVEFPGKIVAGVREYPPVYLTASSEPLIEIVSGSNSDIFISRQKIPFFKRLSKR